jgi:RsbT co-antagonist protein rsbRD N-terminal domain
LGRQLARIWELPPQVFFARPDQRSTESNNSFRTRKKEGNTLMTKIVTERSKNNGTSTVHTESVADILERELKPIIHDWLALVEKQKDLMSNKLSYEDRTGHLPALLREVIARLRLDAGTKAPISVAASHHGDLRRQQGYSVAMVVEESRLLQVCLFTTLHKNNSQIEYSRLLPDVVTIADEVDAQLKQQMLRYMAAKVV